MKLFAKIESGLLFSPEALSKMFDRVLNTPLTRGHHNIYMALPETLHITMFLWDNISVKNEIVKGKYIFVQSIESKQLSSLLLFELFLLIPKSH